MMTDIISYGQFSRGKCCLHQKTLKEHFIRDVDRLPRGFVEAFICKDYFIVNPQNLELWIIKVKKTETEIVPPHKTKMNLSKQLY